MASRRRLFLLSALVAAGMIAGPAAVRSATVVRRWSLGTSPAAAADIPMLAISPGICMALAAPQDTDAGMACLDLTQPASLHAFEQGAGNNNGTVEPADFASVDLDGDQLHQEDAHPSAFNGSLFIVAFVPGSGPVTFTTNRGGFWDAAGTSFGPTWTCDSATVDADCEAGAPGADGVVVAQLRAQNGSDVAPLGTGTVVVRQSSVDAGAKTFFVVGEPQTLSLFRLEDTIQDGVDMNGNGSPFDPGECEPSTTLAGFTSAMTTPERSLVIARATDIQGTAVTGASIAWMTDDASRAVVGSQWGPTVDLGSFGIGAPTVVCGNATTGISTVSAMITNEIPASAGGSGQIFDPNAVPATATVDFTVVGPPASIALSADPPSVMCEGGQGSTVTATITDADGNAVAEGNPVTFGVVALGIADPVGAATDRYGIASSIVTPLAGVSDGVTVVVSSGSAVNEINVACTQPTETPTASPTDRPTATSTPTQVPAIERVEPDSVTTDTDASSVNTDVTVSGVSNLGAYEVNIVYDPAVVEFASWADGGFLNSNGRTLYCLLPVLKPAGVSMKRLQAGCVTMGLGAGPDGSGTLATVTWSIVGAGSTALDLSPKLGDPLGDEIAAVAEDGAITVEEAPTATATPTATWTATDTVVPSATATRTAVPTATSAPSAQCMTFGQKIRLALGIFRAMGARQRERHLHTQYDLNADGRIDYDDLLIALRAPACSARGR